MKSSSPPLPRQCFHAARAPADQTDGMEPVGRFSRQNIQQEGRRQDERAREHGSAFQLESSVNGFQVQMFPDHVRQAVQRSVQVIGGVQGWVGFQP